MKLFVYQPGLTSYRYPLVKTIACLGVIAIVFAVRFIPEYSRVWVDIVSGIICVVFLLASILCLYISIFELDSVRSNRKNSSVHYIDTKTIDKEHIIDKAIKDDAIEFEIWTGSKLVKIGSHINYIMSKNILTDKRYFIETTEYESAEAFVQNLAKVFPEQNIRVARIDGMPIKRIPDLSKY